MKGTSTVTSMTYPLRLRSWSSTSIVVPVPAWAMREPIAVLANRSPSRHVSFRLLISHYPNAPGVSPSSGEDRIAKRTMF